MAREAKPTCIYIEVIRLQTEHSMSMECIALFFCPKDQNLVVFPMMVIS